MLRSRFLLFSCYVVLCVANQECGPNEEFSDCMQAVCRHMECKEKTWPIGCPGIAAGSCLKGCLCKAQYLRDDSGVCIPEDQCKPNLCGPNEEWSDCTQAICRPQECSEKGEPVACPAVADGDCKAGCVCQENFLRSLSGCVPEHFC